MIAIPFISPDSAVLDILFRDVNILCQPKAGIGGDVKRLPVTVLVFVLVGAVGERNGQFGLSDDRNIDMADCMGSGTIIVKIIDLWSIAYVCKKDGCGFTFVFLSREDHLTSLIFADANIIVPIVNMII